MKSDPEDGMLRRYFLGDLSQEEADGIERRLLTDEELFELAEAVETDLLAACARGELAPAERERVLRRLASSPQGRERLALVQGLNTLADERAAATPTVVPFRRQPPPSRMPALRWAALAASLVIAAGLSWFAIDQQPERRDSAPLTTEEAPAYAQPVQPSAPPERRVPSTDQTSPQAPDRVAGEAPRERPAAPPAPLGRVVLQLALAVQRGEGTAEQLRIGPGVGAVELQLDVAGFEDLKSFAVTVRNREQGIVWQQEGIEPQALDWGSALVLEVPAEKLAAGRYEVQVQGITAGDEREELSSQEIEVVRNSNG